VLTVDTTLTVNVNMTIQSGGKVTHTVRQVNGLTLNVAGTLDVQPGGLIDVNAMGLLGANNGSLFSPNNGEAYDASGTNIVSGSGSGPTFAIGCGGAYGGAAAQPPTDGPVNAVYGVVEDPRNLGSGGGSASFSHAGNGGGRIAVTAGTLIVNGIVRANGGAGVSRAAGGSGGAIKIDAASVTGTGAIQAIGGSVAGTLATAGSGGRIAISYDTLSFPDANLAAQAGTVDGADKSASGTIYLKDNAQANGDLIIDNGGTLPTVDTPLQANATAFRSVKVRNQGRLGSATAGLTLHAVQVSAGLFASSANLTITDGNDFVLSGVRQSWRSGSSTRPISRRARCRSTRAPGWMSSPAASQWAAGSLSSRTAPSARRIKSPP
jgi:hypothetical protein